jgi:hypothetical protein
MTDVTQAMVDQLVSREHQYLDAANAPLNNIRMAWPFKTEEELVMLSKWFKKQDREVKEKQVREHVERFGESFL